jgi:hypothetical protein
MPRLRPVPGTVRSLPCFPSIVAAMDRRARPSRGILFNAPGKLSRHIEFQLLCDRLREPHWHRVPEPPILLVPWPGQTEPQREWPDCGAPLDRQHPRLVRVAMRRFSPAGYITSKGCPLVHPARASKPLGAISLSPGTSRLIRFGTVISELDSERMMAGGRRPLCAISIEKCSDEKKGVEGANDELATNPNDE